MADENKFGDIVSKCWNDEAFKKRFMSDPKSVLAEHGMAVPEGLNVKVVENTDDLMHITLPPKPAKPGELSDAALDQVSGGAGTITTSPTLQRTNYTLITSTIQRATLNQQTSTCGKNCIPW
jgi:hypothetical protein